METEEVSAETVIVPSKNDVIDVTVHPLVLLSAADHYHRVARGTRKRVVGILLGSVYKGRVDATNSFAVPFEEDTKNPVSKILIAVGCGIPPQYVYPSANDASSSPVYYLLTLVS